MISEQISKFFKFIVHILINKKKKYFPNFQILEQSWLGINSALFWVQIFRSKFFGEIPIYWTFLNFCF